MKTRVFNIIEASVRMAKVLLEMGLRALVRERNYSRAHYVRKTSHFLIEDLAKLVAEFCYGEDVIIPEKITEFFTNRCEFNAKNESISYSNQNHDSCIYIYDRVDWKVNYVNIVSWMNFILTGYDNAIYTAEGISIFDDTGVKSMTLKKEYNMLRREMLDAAAEDKL